MKNVLSFFVLYLPIYLLAQNVMWSEGRGFYTSAFQLSLTSDIPGGTIRYTLDGSPPSTTDGILYNSLPLSITTTTVVRAIAYLGATVSPVETNTYIFLNDVLQQPRNIAGWPNNSYDIGSGSATAIHDYGMDPSIVNNVAYSGSIEPGLLSIPTMSIVMDQGDFWTLYDGFGEYPGSVEILYPNNSTQNEQFDCGIEPHSHLRLKRSLKLDIKKRTSSNLLTTNPITGVSATTEFDDTKLVLRGGNNRSWARNWNPDRTAYTRDEWYRSSQLAASGIGSRGTFVHLYINGLYWGLYNPVHRMDAGSLVAYFGGDFTDWMTLNHDEVKSGDPTRYNYLINTLIPRDMTLQANYNEAKEYIDVERYIDYLMVTWMMGMSDWPGNNFYGGNRNVPAKPFNYFAWDGEWSWDVTQGSNEGAWVHPEFESTTTSNSPIAALWHSLRVNSEFMQLFADRVYLQCFNSGPLTDDASRARWSAINQFIETAIIAESARWGDGLDDGQTRTKSDWSQEVTRVDGLMNGNVARFLTALRYEGYYPDLDPVLFNKEGGSVTSGFTLEMTNPNAGGTIYYTTDGSDPKLPNGTISPTAVVYSSPIAVPGVGSLTIRSRVKNASEWSAAHDGAYTVLKLFINEFLASNTTSITDASGAFEDWIEIYNGGALPVDLGGMYITDDLTNLTKWQIPSTDPTTTTIAPGGHMILWADNQPNEGPLHVNIKLSAGGEQIGLSRTVDALIEVVDSLTFDAQTADVSAGRFPDGNTLMTTFTAPTPGLPNDLLFSKLYINEFMASNASDTTDESGAYADWIEIYNDEVDPVDIGGMFITDDLSNPLKWKITDTIPAQTTIPGKGFILLWADNDPEEGPLHVDFKLSAGGEQIGLTEVVGTDTAYVQTITFGPQITDISTGREPDGGATFREYIWPTPGRSNIIPFATDLFFNEVMGINATSITDNNGENDPWIEIYNAKQEPVDIGGLYISNDPNTPALWQIPATDPGLTTIPAGGFLLLWADNQTAQGILHLPFLLNNAGGELILTDILGSDVATVDTLVYPAQVADISYGRYPDGYGQLKTFTSPTPGSSNILPYINDIFINEFLAGNTNTNSDAASEYDDWVELYNGGATAVDVGGLFITDDLNKTTSYQIPTTSPLQTTIQPGGFLLLWCDEQLDQGILHIDIKLSSNGEQIGLFQINGDSTHVVDSLSFLVQTDDISAGRSTDGAPIFVPFTTPTPNASNGAGSFPVELINFEGEMLEPDEVLLEWTTASEFNNAYFEVQKSPTGNDFQAIGQVGGAGTTAEFQAYSYTDLSVMLPSNYFRLRQVDFDGTFTYSEVIEIKASHFADQLLIYPNPTSDHLWVSLIVPDPGDTYQMTIRDMHGRVILKKRIAASEIEDHYYLDMKDLASGMYQLKLVGTQGANYIGRFMRQ